MLFLLFVMTFACVEKSNSPVSEIIRFESGGDMLEGQLDLPANEGKFPLAVFVHGSGQATRANYREYVQHFNNAGIATFRYDKRGVGSSGGVYTNVGTENSEEMFRVLASDAAAAAQHLIKDSRIDKNKIILIGGSQAGWIIPVAAKDLKPWLTVCISGPSVSVGEEIYYSDFAEHGTFSQQEADEKVKSFNGIRGYDPIETIKSLDNPSLWIFGGRDVSIPVTRCVDILKSIKAETNIPLDIQIYPEGDHGLFNMKLGRREDHVTYITEWINSKK